MAWNEPGPGRDPWNQGGKRGDGPPDLDEMLKRLKARFGGGRGGRPAGGGGGGMAVPSGIAGLLLALVVGLWLFSGTYSVDEQERAVVLQFGRYVATTEPGLRWRWPWPIQRAELVNVTGVRTTRDKATMLTRDENIVDIELSVQYRVLKVEDYVFNVADPDLTLKQATRAAVREVVGQTTMDDIIALKREEVADRTKVLLQERLDEYKTGLIVSEVNLQDAQAPEPVQAAFAEAIRSREDQERLKNEAQAYANDRLPKARGAAARLIAEATAYRDQVLSRAEGDAARFSQLYTEYKRAPKVTRERMYLDTMSSVLGNASKVVIDVDKGGPMIYLPLDQMMRGAGRTDGGDFGSGAAASPSRSATPAPIDPRTRERERP